MLSSSSPPKLSTMQPHGLGPGKQASGDLPLMAMLQQKMASDRLPLLPPANNNSTMPSNSQNHPLTSRAYTGLHSPLGHPQHIPFSDFLLRQIDSAECKCFMGLFAELERVWLTVDNRFILWNYRDGVEFFSYEDLDSVILTCGLVRPKSGIFCDDVAHLIVLVSATDIRILGVSTSTSTSASNAPSDDAGLHLLATDIQLPTDGVLMLCVAGTQNGQIWLGGRDGHVYEVVYEYQETWFTRKCQLRRLTGGLFRSLLPAFFSSASSSSSSSSSVGAVVQLVVDEDRGVLYSLADSGHVTVHRLSKKAAGRVEWSIESSLRVSVVDACKSSGGVLNGRSGSVVDVDSFHVISIFALASSTSAGASTRQPALVAVTARGYRVYMALSPANGLEVLHIRALPSIEDERDVNARAIPFTHFDTALVRDGVFFAAGTCAQSGNLLFTSCLDTGSIIKSRQFFEWCSISNTVDRVWDVAETATSSAAAASGTIESGAYNELSTQLTRPPRAFVMLTNHGVYQSVKRRPVDILMSLLSQANGYENESLKLFLESYTGEQICVMCLGIACGNDFVRGGGERVAGLVVDSQLKAWATQLFLRYGMQQQQQQLQHSSSRGGLLKFGGGIGAAGMFDLGRPVGGVGSSFDGDNLSVAFHAVVLYMARIVDPVWNLKLLRIVERDMPSIHGVITGGVHLAELLKQLMSNVSVDQNELAYFDMFLNMVDLVVQGSHFVLLLVANSIPRLVDRMKGDCRAFAESCTFAGLIGSAPGSELVREFTRIMILAIIASNRNIDPICHNLKNACGSFFKAEDIKIFKAQECIQMAETGREDPLELLNQSSTLLVDAAGHIHLNTLKSVCESYLKLGYPEGTVRVPIACARKADPENLALQYYKNPTMGEYASIYHHRLEYYQLVFDTLREILSGMPTNPDVQTQDWYKNSQVIRAIIAAEDELFMYLFFDYMLSERQLVYLVKVPNMTHLQTYLHERQYEKAELGFYLGLLYRNRREYDKATMAFKHLAESPKSNANLEKRLEYLSWALNIAQSQLVSEFEPDFLMELKDIYDVAIVQYEILRSLEAMSARPQLIQELNCHLLNVTELYKICNDCNLYEHKLAIFKVSNHRDDALLEQTWTHILFNQFQHEDRVSKLISLGEKFGKSDVAFPIDIIIRLLESEAYGMNRRDPATWIFIALMKAGFKFGEVFEVYDHMFEDKGPPFNDKEGQLYLLTQILSIMKAWVAESSDASDRKLMYERIARYVAYLSVIGDPSGGRLLTAFQTFQSEINRI
eukprot:Partr_v1_DN28575_c1_g1_i1_m73965 putative nucleoporin